MQLETVGLSTWGEALPASGFEVFHSPAALAVLDDHTDAEMRLYGAYKGEQVVGLFPAFVTEHPLGRTVVSPPPDRSVPRLGPLVMPASPKQRKREAVNREFVELLVDELGVDGRRSLVHLRCPTGYDDPRPFDWAGLRVEPTYTYVLDVADRTTEEVKAGFSKSLRRELRDVEDLDVTVSVEGPDAVDRIHEDVAARFDDQGEPFGVPAAYVRDVVRALDERARVYVARTGDGEYLGGLVVLYSNDVAAFWQGGVARTYEGVSVNTALHWAAIADVVADPPVDGVWGYDLVGANTPRLCQYKAKFGADLVGYPTVESAGVRMSVAKRVRTLVDR